MKSIAWDIWLYCNYDCKFCSTKTRKLTDNLKNVNEIISAWQDIHNKYGRCKIYITGGEPLLYPGIFEIIKKLLKIHDVHITTNLSTDEKQFLNSSIDIKHIFINTTFHPYYIDADKFIIKLLNLKKYGYEFSVSYMNDDLQMAEFINYKRIFDCFDIKLVLTANSSDNKIKLIETFADNNLLNTEIKEEQQTISNNFCNAGKNYACINNLGDVFVCSIKRQNLGNIYAGSFNFLKEPVQCDKKCILSENQYC